MNILESPTTAPESERAFNEARKLYEQLRELDPHSRAYLDTVVDMIRSCQAILAVDSEHGEAHVLLAYSFYLLHLYSFPLRASCIPLSHAAAVIQHWSDQPIRQHLSAANVEKGCRVYDLIAGELSEMRPECAEREEMEMRLMETSQYFQALAVDPRDWVTIGMPPE